LKEEEEKKKVE